MNLCREKLVDQFSSMLEIENNDIAGVVLNVPFRVSLVNVMLEVLMCLFILKRKFAYFGMNDACLV